MVLETNAIQIQTNSPSEADTFARKFVYQGRGDFFHVFPFLAPITIYPNMKLPDYQFIKSNNLLYKTVSSPKLRTIIQYYSIIVII